MGIYFNHSVIYLIKFKDGFTIIIATSKDTDARLVESNFYKQDPEYWLKFIPNQFCKKIISLDFDVKLTEKEQANLNILLKKHESEIESHGLFDINSMSDTY